MNIFDTELFTLYLTGDHLKGRNRLLVIQEFREEYVERPDGNTVKKQVLIFDEPSTRLILNKTNARALAEMFGPETDNWRGKQIELYAEEKKVFGKARQIVKIRKEEGDDGN